MKNHLMHWYGYKGMWIFCVAYKISTCEGVFIVVYEELTAEEYDCECREKGDND